MTRGQMIQVAVVFLCLSVAVVQGVRMCQGPDTPRDEMASHAGLAGGDSGASDPPSDDDATAPSTPLGRDDPEWRKARRDKLLRENDGSPRPMRDLFEDLEQSVAAPPSPVNDHSSNARIQEPQEETPPIRLTATLRRKKEGLAVINGRVRRLGEAVDLVGYDTQARVVAIHRSAVDVSWNGATYRIDIEARAESTRKHSDIAPAGDELPDAADTSS